MAFREPTPSEVREILLLGDKSRRSGLSEVAPGESIRDYLYATLGQGADDLSNDEKREIARRLYSGGISTGAIACILHLESRKSTVDYWVRKYRPKEVATLDGKVRPLRPPKRTKRWGTPPLTAEAPTPRAVLDALIALRRARVPVKDRPDYLRRFRGLPEDASVDQRLETARELAAKGFTASVISPIVGIPRATVYRWIADVESGLRYGIRGTELGDNTGREAENLF